MADLLDMEKINALPQPLLAKILGTWWPINDICVETGLMRIDVCGLLDRKHFTDATMLRDDLGQEHDPDLFYLEDE